MNPAEAGSALLADLGTISAIKLWLEPLKFVGIAMLLSGIGLALASAGARLLQDMWSSGVDHKQLLGNPSVETRREIR